jgi:hypothetical protein
MTLEIHKKIIDWFIEDIKENLAYSDGDLSDQRILKIAINKTNDLVRKCFKGEDE